VAPTLTKTKAPDRHATDLSAQTGACRDFRTARRRRGVRVARSRLCAEARRSGTPRHHGRTPLSAASMSCSVSVTTTDAWMSCWRAAASATPSARPGSTRSARC